MADKFEWNGDEPETTYDPSSVEVDRARQQGLGMGARDLARQRDPGDPGDPGDADAPDPLEAEEDATDAGSSTSPP